MSSTDTKRSKRRRNKRGNGKAKQKLCSANAVTNDRPSAVVSSAPSNVTDSLSHTEMHKTFSELDLDNIPQTLTQLPKSHNPYLDREVCLLCHTDRHDPTKSSWIPTMDDGKDGDDQMPISPMSLWLCPECRRKVEEGERNSIKENKMFGLPSLPQEDSISANVPLVTSQLGSSLDLSSGDGVSLPKVSKGPCACLKCREQREILAEEENVNVKLGTYWSELSHMVRCVYLEAGTALADEDSSTKLCLPRISELVELLCTHDPHQLFLRLEIEVEDFVKEVKDRILKRLGEGYKSPPLAKQLITMLMEEYTALISASKSLSTVLEKLENGHLSKFNLTWVLHNKHLFHSMVYLEPELHNKLSQLLKYIQQGSQKESTFHSQESYYKLCQRYLKFTVEMTELSEGWRKHQQLIESYVEERAINRNREFLAQRPSWDISKFPPVPYTKQCTSMEKHCSQSGGDNKENGPTHKPCTCKTKCLYQSNRVFSLQRDLYEELSHEDGIMSSQLTELDSYSYLQSIQPPNLSSPSSSQDDSEDLVPIFSRQDYIPPGMCSPCSEDSIDSDDLTSESSQDASQDAGYEEDDESESCSHKRSRTGGTTQDKLNLGTNNTKGESPYQGSQTCECHACITSAMQNAKLLPNSTSVSSSTDTGTTLTADLQAQASPYLFYPNLTNHQPLDLSHHGITAKHPLIHPHLYNLSSQKPNTKSQQQPFPLMDTSPQLSSELSAYENAKISLQDTDLLQSVKDALQNNCKMDKSGLQSSYVGKLHNKEISDDGSNFPRVCNQASRDGVGMYSSAQAQFSVDAWAQQQLMARLQQQQHNSSGSSACGTTDTNTQISDFCPKHLTQAPRISNTGSVGKTQLLAQPPTAVPSDSSLPNTHQHPHIQPISPLLQNGPINDPHTSIPGKHAPLVDPSSIGQPPSLTSQQQQQHILHQSTCKKKKASDLSEHYHQGYNTSCCMQMPEFGQEPHQQQICALHNQHAVSSSAGSTVDPLSAHTAGSTPTSASVCSDPDCDTHNFNDDDLYANSDERSSSTTSSSRERDSKHCGCCYCEVFGHGGPVLAPMSRNYPEMRDRLRLKLRERKQIPKDESPSGLAHTDSPDENHIHKESMLIDVPSTNTQNLDDIVSFIKGEEAKPKLSSKAAKRQRQKQKKAEQKARQESRSRPEHCLAKDQSLLQPLSLEKCQNLSTQSTPTKSHKGKHDPTSSDFQQQLLIEQANIIHHSCTLGLMKAAQNSQVTGKLKITEKRKTRPCEGVQEEIKCVTAISSNKSKTVTPQKATEEQRKERRPKSAASLMESINSSRNRVEKSEKKLVSTSHLPNEFKQETNISKKEKRVEQETQHSGKALRPVCLEIMTNGVDRFNGSGSKGTGGGDRPDSTPGTPQKQSAKKEHAKKEVHAPPVIEDKKKTIHNGNSSHNKQGNKLKGKIIVIDQNMVKSNNNSPASSNGSKLTGGIKRKEIILENGGMDIKNHVFQKQTNNHKKATDVAVRPSGKMVNGISGNDHGHCTKTNHLAGNIISTGHTNSSSTSSRKKKKKKGDNGSSTIDEIFLPKENVDMNDMDEVEQELEAFKRFCMDSTPQQKKEKVFFNVKDLFLSTKKSSAH